MFFGMLEQFLNPLADGEYFNKLEPGQERAFINYFNREDYMSWFDDSKNKEFALRLMDSQLFASFCDDYLDKDVSNMLIYLNISRNGFDFDDWGGDTTMKAEYEKRMRDVQSLV